MTTKHYDVFLSHHSAEKPAVEFLARKLEDAGVRPFLDQWQLIPGEPIQEGLEAALDQSATCAVFVGAKGPGPWANEEMRAALAERVRNSAFHVIPVLLPGAQPDDSAALPPFLKRLLWVDFRGGLENEDAFERLLAGIRGHAPKLSRENASPEQMRLVCPYRGLSAFREEDEALFFGRERCAEKLLSMVQQQPFVAVLGASGSGKSSLVYAGLIPNLRSQNNWLIASFRPGEYPLSALAKTLIPFLYQDPLEHISKSKQLAEQLQSGEIVLKDVIEKILDADDKANRFLLVIDQFEELYALCDDAEERAAFILGINPQSQSVSRLKPAISESKQGASASFSFEPGDLSPGIHIILTLRSDFLGQTHSQPELSQAIANNHIIIPAMNRDDLRRAIAEPASRAGFPLHDEVVDLLLEQSAGREGALPLLEFALTRIWEGLARGVEPAETLQQIGGVGGALANQAQDLFDKLNESEQQIARRAFRRMTRLGEGTQDSRRRVNIADIIGHKNDPQQVRRVLNHFAQPGVRLITLDEDTAEITHEALFEHWEALKSWLDAGRDDLRFHRQLEETVKEWEAHKRPAGSLWRLPKLDLLRQYYERNEQDMTALQVAFLQESEQKERHSKQIRRIAMTVLVVLTMIAMGAAGVALWAYNQANEQKIEANRQKAEAVHHSHVSLIRSLVAYALQDNAQEKRERAALLARQAALLNQRFDSNVDNQIENALRTIFRTSSIVEDPYSPILVEQVCQKVTLKKILTLDEWKRFVGDEISYEPTCPQLLTDQRLQLRSEIMTATELEALSLNLREDDWGYPIEYIENDFEDRGDVIFDRATGLTWQRSVSKKAVTYDEALEYIAQLNRMQFGGYDDWRLPTMEELLSLIEPEKQSNGLHIDPIFETPDSLYLNWVWSGDLRQIKNNDSAWSAWCIGFNLGGVLFSDHYYVRAIRS